MNLHDVVRLLGLTAPTCAEGEASGQVVPGDFELLLRAVPAGVVAGSVILNRADVPVRSVKDFAAEAELRLGDMREALTSREQALPASLHPEPGGLVPWGRTARDGVLLWDTAAPDTEDWTTILADKDFQLWLDLPFSASEFVARTLMAREEGTPAFESFEEYESGSFWKVADDMRATAMAMANRDVRAVDELVTRLRALGVPGVREYAQERVARALEAARESSLAYPEEYLAVMREFPGGVIAGMEVFPVDRVGWLTEDPVFLQWGELEGRAFGWLALGGDPAEWRVAYVEPGGTSLTHLHDQTFASFLRRRLRGDNSLF
ncbi:hypothetical protein [Streptomyces wuyuanensis]|uniref:hypothetical protein n=1 Tax=Streptomyces wuyuanensis TaxID=1196353 RepID=UPI003715579A